jgi:hypothetical protein
MRITDATALTFAGLTYMTLTTAEQSDLRFRPRPASAVSAIAAGIIGVAAAFLILPPLDAAHARAEQA